MGLRVRPGGDALTVWAGPWAGLEFRAGPKGAVLGLWAGPMRELIGLQVENRSELLLYWRSQGVPSAL